MDKKKTKDARRASKKLRELLGDKPFGIGAEFSWDDRDIAYDDWDGEFPGASEDDDDDDDHENWYADDDDDDRRPLDFN
jgi:hypothetical protein